MTQQIIDTGAQPDDGQGDPLRTAFSYTNDNFTEIYQAGPVGSNVRIANNTITTTVINSDLVLSPSGIGKIQVNNNVLPRSDDVYELGSSTQRFNAIYLGTGGLNSNGIITTTGNISAGYFIGDGSLLTGITANAGSKLSNGTSNINIPSSGSNILVSVSGTANVVTFSNTGAYIIGTVSATGNISGDYILGNGALLTGLNLNYSNANVAAYLPTYTGNLVSLTGPIITTANITGGNVATGNVRAGNIVSSGIVSATGNITGRYFIGDGSQLTNLPVSNYSNANVAAYLPTYTGSLASLTGPVITTANVTGGNLQTSGTISATGNITGGNVATGRVNAGNITVSGPVSATGNITGSYFIGNGSQLTGIVTNYSNANVAAYLPTYTGSLASLTGPVITTANVVGSNILTTGVISTAGNITGGNIATGRVNAGNVTVSGPISATGNVTGSYFIGDGSQLTNLPAGNYSNANVAAYLPTYTGSLASLTGPVITTNNIAGSSLSIVGNITGGNVDTGRVNAGNVTVSGPVSATGNITGSYFIGDGSLLTNLPAGNYSNANVASYLPTYTGSLDSLTGPVVTTGNITGGNLRTAGAISSTGNITSGNVDTGRVNAGNVTVSGPVLATGNITGSYFIGNGSQLTGIAANYSNANVAAYLPTYTGSLASLTGPVITTSSIAGSSLSIVGNVTGGNVDTGRVNAGNVTVSGPVSATGNITGSYFIGDGSLLTNLPAGNYSNANVAAYLPTYTGSLDSLTGLVTTTANVTGGNLKTSGTISATGNITGGNVATGTINSGNILSSGAISATGNITGSTITSGNILPAANVTYDLGTSTQRWKDLWLSNSTIYLGDARISANATAVVVTNPAGGNTVLQGTPGNNTVLSNIVSASGNITGGNVTTTGLLSVTGNITGGNLDIGRINAGNITVSGPLSTTGNVTGSYFIGDGSLLTNLPAGNYSNANVALYLPTYTGSLPSLTGAVITTANVIGGNVKTTGTICATGNITGGNVDTGNVTAGNVSAFGNITGSYFIGDGSLLTNLPAGNYSNANVASYLPTYTGSLPSLTGPVITLSNITGSNLRTSGSITATGNITGNNVDTNTVIANAVLSAGIISTAGNVVAANIVAARVNATTLTASANVIAGNVTTIGLISATGNINGGNFNAPGGSFTGFTISVNGTVTGGNLTTLGIVSAFGNITGGNIDTGNIHAGNVISNAAITAIGNIYTSQYFIGNGAFITGLATYSNANVAAFLPTYTGNLVSLTGPVITTANIVGANITASGMISAAGTITSAANITGSNLITSGLITATGNLTAGNLITNGLASITGNITSGNVLTAGQVSATGNITGSNIRASGAISASGSITTDGSLTLGNTGKINFGTTGSNIYLVNLSPTTLLINAEKVDFTGSEVTAASITGGNVNAPNNLNAGNVLANGIISTTGNLYASNLQLSGSFAVASLNSAGNINAGNLRTTGQVTATGNVAGGNILTNGLVSAAGNVTGNYFIGNGSLLTGIVVSGGTSIDNGTSNVKVGAPNSNVTIGVSAVGNVAVFSPTGLSVLGNVAGTFLLGNGAFITGVAKATSADSVANGTSNVNIPTINGNVTVGVAGTSNIAVFSTRGLSVLGNVTGNYILGNGAFITGLPAGYSNADVANYMPTYSGNLPNLTGLVSTTGNVSGNYILGNGALLTGVITSVANINNGTSNINIATSGGNITVDVGGTSNVVVFATSGEYVTGLLSVSGNIIGGNLLTNGSISATANIISGNLLTSGLISSTGNVIGGNLLTSGLISSTGNIVASNFVGNLIPPPGGVVSTTGNISGGNVLTSGFVSAAGNVTGNYFIGNGSQLTGVTASSVNANALVGNTLSSNVLYSSLTSVGTLGNLSVTGNIDAGNLRTAGLVSATANITGGNVLTAGLVSATGNATAGNFLTAGLISATGNVDAGNLVTGGKLNIGGTVIGNLVPDADQVYDLGGPGAAWRDLYLSGFSLIIGNQKITSNTTGVTTSNTLSAGNVTTTGTISAVGDLVTAGIISATGNATVGNLQTAGLVTATGNITGGNILTAGLMSSTGNATVGNLQTAGLITATGNVIAGNLRTVGLITATGNITGGNILTAGLMSSTGNATANNVIITGGTLAFANANIVQTNPLDLAITGAYQISVKSGGGGYQWTFGNDGTLSGPTGLATTGYLSAAGNIFGNNIFATTLVSVAGNVIAANVNTNTIRPTSGELTITTATGNLNLQPAGNIVLANTYVNSVAYPQQDTDAATKLYVDNMVSTALTFHQAVYAATTTTLATDTGGSITYTQPNGVANGVGATLTTTGTFNLIDTANVQTIGTRILVKNEANTVYNGVYTWANATNIVRSTDTDEYGPNSVEQISINDYFFVQNGTTNGGSAYVVDSPSGTITFGTSGITFAQFSQASIYTANTSAGLSLVGSQFNAKVDNDTTAFDAGGNISVKAGANLTTPNIGAATGTSLSLVGNAISGNILTGGLISAAGNITGLNFIGNIVGNVTGLLGNNVNMGTNSAGALVSNAVTLTANTTITNGIALLNQILGKLVPPSPPNFPGANTLSLSGIATYRMANITQVDNTPGANRSVAAGTSVANVLRVATYATNTIANVGPGDSGTITAVRNGSNVGNVTLNTNASPSANGTYGGNLIISNNFDYNSANANITAGFWYVFSSRVSGTAAPAGWNELYIADSGTGNTNTTVWYYDNSSPSTPSFSSTTMTAPGSANLLYSSTIPHYTNNNNFTIAFNVANISGNTYPGANTLASGSAGGAFAAPTTINYNGSNIGSNILPSFASASANTTVSITTGFGGSSTGPSMSVNNSYSTGTLTLTTALGNTVLWKSGTSTAIEESNVVINTTIGTGSGNAFRITNPGTGNTPAYTGSEAAFNSQTGPLQTYDATVVGSGSAGVLKHDQTNYASGYLPVGPNLSAGRTGTQYFTFKFVRTAVSKFDIKYTGTIAGMWVALPGSVIDSSSSANGWINMSVAYGGAGYPGVNSPGNGSDGCAVGGVVSLNTSVTNSSKTCTFGTVSSSSTATNEIYVRIALTSGQSVTALTLETASN